jgi:hypothetical protein
MLFQQAAKLGVLRPEGSLRGVHIAMIVDRDAARQDPSFVRHDPAIGKVSLTWETDLAPAYLPGN